jgi:hypothetical protein
MSTPKYTFNDSDVGLYEDEYGNLVATDELIIIACWWSRKHKVLYRMSKVWLQLESRIRNGIEEWWWRKEFGMRTAAEFAEGISKWVVDNIQSKFWKGDNEHGGRLWRKQCLPHLREELIDAVTYLAVVEDQMQKARVLLSAALAGAENWGLVAEAYNIMKHGNPEGETEEELGENPNEKLSYSEVHYG